MPTPTPSEPVLDIADLVVTFGAVTALDSLSLRALRGHVTALLGPNGAGKTTLLRTCTGLVGPRSGTVRVLGQAPGSPDLGARLGVMPQSTGAWSGVRAGELVHFLAGLYATPLDPDTLITHLGIDAFARTTYRRLSGGQKQAVNLAGAIVGRPELVFLDEPTAGMDPHARRRTWALVRDLRAAGVSVLLTTHDMVEAEQLADEVVLIDHGRAVMSGAVPELTRTTSLEALFLSHTDEGV
ncbi:ABC transporter ATP-binding protein [Aestuariimicrobium sp. T2.26MG-19.2B]|uniref:ABC transporter ATP-binding protein n=1 Tax=Aestuariimicrobium sp. T2.26MG-19.2B TaxID=3040679 RepID=UPI002477A011|nr:ABC transporter ATP-binding protein [Aestuariimicrobium sp. T2.26MG-19.2B]CAI9399151.1 Daunorubicin/doxorubicin resistance ATP-binding protein DrrA [Aestuariimicrobium sp. T2.26MG-19.2B]